MTLGNCLLHGRNGLEKDRETDKTVLTYRTFAIEKKLERDMGRKQQKQETMKNLRQLPDKVLAQSGERLLLIMAKHFKHNRLGLYVLHKRLGNLHSNLKNQRSNV